MSDHYKFLRHVVCDGRECQSDEVVADDEIQPGTLESCLRMGHCVPCDPAGLPHDLTTDAVAPDVTTAAPPKAPPKPPKPPKPKHK